MSQLARQSIDEFEQNLKLVDGPDPTSVRHYFANGLYARELFLPKGTFIVGKIHKCEHINILSMGDITVVTTEGRFRLQAPYTMVSMPGSKRVGYTHEDTLWTTIHAVESRDLEEIEEMVIAKTYDEYL